MAKAQFHKNQRVYVRPVGTWSTIERVVQQWAKGVEEPIRIFYELGLGREFGAEELEHEQSATSRMIETDEEWRVIRGVNKWTSVEESASHPFPGSYPVVVTGPNDWGGWRVPGSEYDLDPYRIERQARIIANAQKFITLLNEVIEHAEEAPENVSNRMMDIVQRARSVIANIDAN